MRFHVPAAACQLSSRPLLAGQSSWRGAADNVKDSAARSHLTCRPAGLFSLTLLLLLSHLAGSGAGGGGAGGGGASSCRLGSQGGAPTALSGHLCHSEPGPDPDPQTVARLLESLVTVPHEEVGEVAICASLRNEGRFIVEWLLYVSSRVYSRWLRGRRRARGRRERARMARAIEDRFPKSQQLTSSALRHDQYRVLGVDRFYL